jgi:hypothetical protein
MPIPKSLICRLCLLALFLAPATAEGQWTPKARVFERRAPDAVRELARGLPPEEQRRVKDALRQAFGVKGFSLEGTAPEGPAERMKALSNALKRGNLELKADKDAPQLRLSVRRLKPRVPHLERQPDVVLYTDRVVNSIIHRDEIIRNEKARVVRELEGRPEIAGMKSQLEQFLAQELKLKNASEVAQSFDANVKVNLVELPQEMTLLRLFGGESGPRGRYFFCCLETPSDAPPSVRFKEPFSAWTDARGLATPPENSLDDLAVVRLRAGTKVLVGTVADNFADEAGQYRLGGNTQIYVPYVENFPYKPYRAADRATHPEDIIVFMDNGRVGHFSPQ